MVFTVAIYPLQSQTSVRCCDFTWPPTFDLKQDITLFCAFRISKFMVNQGPLIPAASRVFRNSSVWTEISCSYRLNRFEILLDMALVCVHTSIEPMHGNVNSRRLTWKVTFYSWMLSFVTCIFHMTVSMHTAVSVSICARETTFLTSDTTNEAEPAVAMVNRDPSNSMERHYILVLRRLHSLCESKRQGPWVSAGSVSWGPGFRWRTGLGRDWWLLW